MVFRANEASLAGFETAKNKLVSKDFSPSEKEKSEETLRMIIDECGDVIQSYPIWHPLVSNNDPKSFITIPEDKRCGYIGLDHNIYFVNGFITCPYGDPDVTINSIDNLKLKEATKRAVTMRQKFLIVNFILRLLHLF